MSKTEVLTDESPMPYGKKYKGMTMANVPADYLMWFYLNVNRDPFSQPVIDYIKENMDVIKSELK